MELNEKMFLFYMLAAFWIYYYLIIVKELGDQIKELLINLAVWSVLHPISILLGGVLNWLYPCWWMMFWSIPICFVGIIIIRLAFVLEEIIIDKIWERNVRKRRNRKIKK